MLSNVSSLGGNCRQCAQHHSLLATENNKPFHVSDLVSTYNTREVAAEESLEGRGGGREAEGACRAKGKASQHTGTRSPQRLA